MTRILGLLFIVSLLQYVTSEITMVEIGPGTVKPSDSLEMICKVTGASLTDSTNMHCVDWIRQTEGKQLEWLGTICYNAATAYASSVQGRLTLTREVTKGEVYFKLTGMKTEESGTYHCARGIAGGAAGYFDVWGKGTLLTVTSEARSPSVFPLMPCCDILSSLSKVTIGCLSTGYTPPPVDVTWNSGSITTGIRNIPAVQSKNGNYISTSLLTISANDFKNNKYTCNVDHKPTNVKINKDIGICEDAKPNPPKVELVQASCGETGSVDLVCLIDDYSPNDIKVQWYLNGKQTSISPTNTTPYKDHEGNFGSRSLVTVPKEDWSSGDVYTCRVSHPPTDTRNEDSIHKCEESSSVSQPKVVLRQPSPKDMLSTKQPKLACEVSKVSNTQVLTIKWKRGDGKRVQAYKSEPEQQFDGTYTVTSFLRLTVPDWESGSTFTCIVEHSDLPAPVEKSIHKRDDPATEPTVYVFPPPSEELAYYDFVSLICLLKNYTPNDVYVQWKKNGVLMEEEKYVNSNSMLDEDTDTYFMYSTATISKTEWNRGAAYTCSGLLRQITSKDIKKTRGK